MRVVLVLMILLLAGCSGGSGPAPEPSSTTASPSSSGLCLDARYRPTDGTCAIAGAGGRSTVDFALAWDGNLGVDAYACQNMVGCVPENAVSPGDSDRQVAAAGWNLTAANLTVTWQAASPATAEMGIAVMTMHCDICNMTDTGVQGPSPLVLQLSGLHEAVSAGGVVHVYLYHTTSAAPGGGTFVYGGPDQAFKVVGTLSFEATSAAIPPGIQG